MKENNKYRIIKVNISGIKSIEKPIEVRFLDDTNYKKKINKYFDCPSIKAIYGLNGVGKSSFVTAFEIYKNLCTSNSYLIEESTIKTFENLINKKTKEFKFKIYFATFDGFVYSHEIIVDNTLLKPYIKSEVISKYNNISINSEYKIILKIEKNKILDFDIENNNSNTKDIDKIFYSYLEKKNEFSTAISVLYNRNLLLDLKNEIDDVSNLKNQGENKIKAKSKVVSLFQAVSDVALFSQSTKVFLDYQDIHREMNLKDYEVLSEYFKLKMEENPMIKKDILVECSKFHNFESLIAKTEKFIQIFKPDLKSIYIDKRNDGDNYRCRLVMKYFDCDVDYEYESSGIKNLISMFSCLFSAANGHIAIIDEMDANINEVYLEKICEYFVEYGKGQLCFTSHNTRPMKVLKSLKHSIDFINQDKKCIPWIKNGNYSPNSQYTEGMIPGITFNTESFDFIEIFNTDN